MSDVLSRILAGALGGGAGGFGGGHPSADEAGRFGGVRRGAPPVHERGGLGGLLGGLMGGAPGAGMGGGMGGGMPGGIGGILGGLLGGMAGGGTAGRGAGSGMGGGLAGSLGGMRGVALMALVTYLLRGRGGAAGLSSLTDSLRGAGLGDHVDSWVSNGPNREIRPEELARAIPPEAMDDIERHTGLGRDEVLSELSRGLPGMVNRLTPQGRLPERDEELNDHDENDVLSSLGIGPVRRG